VYPDKAGHAPVGQDRPALGVLVHGEERGAEPLLPVLGERASHDDGRDRRRTEDGNRAQGRAQFGPPAALDVKPVLSMPEASTSPASTIRIDVGWDPDATVRPK
jgi:hypothetical protein